MAQAGSKIVTIIEDDVDIARMYQTAFMRAGYDTLAANDGIQGINVVTESHPDVVLLDILMPKMNGMQVLKNLKSQPDTKEIPVIMLTNVSGEITAKQAMAEGAENYIIKTEYDPSEIVSIVSDVIHKKTKSK